MNEQELNQILQSDIKLWELAEETSTVPGVYEKTLDLPYGIGPTMVRLENIDDAIKKRGAVAAFGEHIRSLIKDRTDDEAVTARAQQAAAKAEQRDIENGIYVGAQGVSDTPTPSASLPGTGSPHQGNAEGYAGIGDALTAQRAELRERVNRARSDLAVWTRELKALDAACAALEEDDASTDTKTPE